MIIINQKDLNSMITLKLNENFYLHQQVNYIYYKMRIDILKQNQKKLQKETKEKKNNDEDKYNFNEFMKI